jgi:hypothetical protein
MRLPIIAILLFTLTLSQDTNLPRPLFLEYEYPEQQQLKRPSRQEAMELVKGFVKGLEIFNHLPTSDECIKGDEEVLDDIAELIQIIKDIDHNYIDSLKKVVAKAMEIYLKLDNVKESCKQMAHDAKLVLKHVMEYVKTPIYIVELPVHLVKEHTKIKEEAVNAKKLYDEKHYELSGEGFGDLLHFTFLWEYEQGKDYTY